jgi:hypothetical protein
MSAFKQEEDRIEEEIKTNLKALPSENKVRAVALNHILT